MSQNLCHVLRRRGQLLLLAGLFLGGCDSANPPTAPTADAADGLSYTVLTGAESSSALTSDFGCRGSVWLPKRGEYSAVALKLNLPEQIVAAAKGATYTPRFIVRENARPGSRVLLGVECSLPDVQDPKVEKAHKSVARFLAKELNKLQQAADVAARADMGHNGSWSGASGFGTQFSLQTEESCGWELIDSYQNEDGSWTYVYQYKCSGGGGDNGGGGDCGWDGSGCGGGGGGGGDTCDPTMVIGGCPDYGPGSLAGDESPGTSTYPPDCIQPNLHEIEKLWCNGGPPSLDEWSRIDNAANAAIGRCSELSTGWTRARPNFRVFDYTSGDYGGGALLGGDWIILSRRWLADDAELSVAHEMLHVSGHRHGEVRGTAEWNAFADLEKTCSGGRSTM